MSFSIPMHDVYTNLLHWLLVSPIERNERTGSQVKVGRGGVSFRLDLSDGVLPTPGLRRVFPKSAAAENAWYLSGSQDVTWLRQYAPLWDKFVEADGKTIEAAYGYRWRRHFGRDQLAEAVTALRNDSTNRRVYISAWDPAYDGLGQKGQKNVPCPASFSLSVLNGELHSTLFLRSSDVFVGLPYDVMGHSLLMDAVAASLGIRPGVAQFSLAHAHLYEAHWAMAEECLAQPIVAPALRLPGVSIAQITADPDGYVWYATQAAADVEWPQYSPRPEVIV